MDCESLPGISPSDLLCSPKVQIFNDKHTQTLNISNTNSIVFNVHWSVTEFAFAGKDRNWIIWSDLSEVDTM